MRPVLTSGAELYNKEYRYDEVPTIRRFSQSDAFVRGLMGPIGSGKSSGSVIEILRRAAAQEPLADGIRRTRWAVIRNTYRQLEDTTIKTFHQWAPPWACGRFEKAAHNYIIDKLTGLEIEIMFRALDRPDQIANLLSLELTGAWINEAREVPWAVVEGLLGRVGRYPAKEDGGATWSGIFMDTNPPDTDSWWYRKFEEEKPEGWEIFKQPGGLSPQAENRDKIPEDYYERLLSSYDADKKKVYIDAEYGFVMDGRPVYPDYSDLLHCKEIEPMKDVTIERGWDFGLTPAVAFSQLLPNGKWIVIDELTSESMAIDQFSDHVIAHCGSRYPGFTFADTGDPAGMQRVPTDARTCFQILHAKGINIQPGLQDPTIRRESVSKMLRTMSDGAPAFVISPRAKYLRKGFQGAYHYRRVNVSGDRFEDKPNKNFESHVSDALQYTATKLFAQALTSNQTVKVDYAQLARLR